MKKFFSFMFIAVAALSLALSSSAMADDLVEPELPFTPVLSRLHFSWAGLVDGKTNYNSAVFAGTNIGLESDGDEAMTEEMAALTVKMTISGGSFTYGYADYNASAPWFEGTEYPSGSDFTLTPGDVDDYFNFYTDKDFSGSDSNEGLNGYTVSWTSSNTNVLTNGSVTLSSSVKSTKEQLNSAAPYVELTRSGSTVTGLKWRIVNPSDTSKALSSVDGVTGVRVQINFNNGNKNYRTKWTTAAPFEGEITAGSDTFEAFDESVLANIRVDIRLAQHTQQRWFFHPITIKPLLWTAYESSAKLNSDGKASYSDAEFSRVWLSVLDNLHEARMTDAYSSATGTLTVSGGSGYSYGTSSQDAAVTTGSDTLKLAVNPDDCPVGGTGKEWETVNDSGSLISFYGTAETGAMDNLAVKAEFSTAPEMNITTTLPTFRKTSEQLSSYVPYVELITSGSTATGVKWRFVKSDAPDTVLSGIDVKNIRLDAWNKSGSRISWNRDDGSTGGNYNTQISSTFEGTAQFNQSLSLADLGRVKARYTSQTDDKIIVYEWTFYYDASSTDSGSDSGSDSSSSSDTPSAPEIDVTNPTVANSILNILKGLSSIFSNITSGQVYSLTDSNNVTIGSPRSTISDADKNTVGNVKYMVIFPTMSITKTGVYVWRSSKLNIPAGTAIFFHSLPQSTGTLPWIEGVEDAAAQAEFKIADDTEKTYTFLDDEGKETSVVPDNQYVSVAAYLEEGKTYAPVIATAKENTTSNRGSSSSGCNSGLSGLALIIFAGLAAFKPFKSFKI